MCEMGFVLDREGKKSFIFTHFLSNAICIVLRSAILSFPIPFKAGFKRICVVSVLIMAKLQF